MAIERRRAPRQPLIASAEVIELSTNTRLKVRTLDMSLIGCYVDMTNPLPVGTEVRVQILHNDAAFTALGIVVSCAQNMGMAIRFTDVPLDQHEVLVRWLAAPVR
jgi:PilZ domain